MGRRSRRDGDGDGRARGEASRSRPSAVTAPARPRDPRRRPLRDERPKPPWHPVPLAELCVLLGIVLAVVGFFRLEDESGQALLLAGLVLASLGGLETVLREHFTGFRSHSTVLAMLPTVAVAGVLFFARAPIVAILAAVAIVFVLAFAGFRSAFQRRAGVAWR